jgi:hypothetical protein
MCICVPSCINCSIFGDEPMIEDKNVKRKTHMCTIDPLVWIRTMYILKHTQSYCSTYEVRHKRVAVIRTNTDHRCLTRHRPSLY